MTNKELLDLYTDYLISSFGLTTGTGLSALLGGSVSHDRIQRFLSKGEFTSADLWHFVKPHVRAVEQADGCIIVDDSISEKPYTDENDIIAWHYDHSKGTTVKGINFLSALYHVPQLEVSLPVGFRLVRKTEQYVDKKDGKTQPTALSLCAQRRVVRFGRQHDVLQEGVGARFHHASQDQPQGGFE